MKKIILFISFVLMLMLPSYSAQWTQINENLYIDSDSIEPYINDYGNVEPYRYVFWIKRMNNKSNLFISLENYYKKEITYFMDKQIIDTRYKKYAIKVNNIHGSNSELIHNFDFIDFRLDWRTIAPDSMQAELLKIILKYQEEHKPPVEVPQKSDEVDSDTEI